MRIYASGMSRRMILLLAVLGLPYGYLAFYWTAAIITQGEFSAHMLFYTFVALVALPFLMAIIGGGLALGGARRVAAAGRAQAPASRAAIAGMRGGVRFWIGLTLLLWALPACIALLSIVLDRPEEGRDRLGRICESNGSTTTCRPDPDAERPSELERANRALNRQRWFEKD